MSGRIYVASLADYNAGVLHGEWFDLTDYSEADALHEDVRAMLAKSPTAASDPHVIAEEWAIHDYEGFGGYRVSEWADFETLIEFSWLVEEHGPAFAIWAEYVMGYRMADAVTYGSSFTDSFAGEMTALDWTYDYVEECIFTQDTPETLRTYFNYEAFARDLLLGGDMTEVYEDGRTWLFHRN